MTRPIYLGTGECECGKLDIRLYSVPNTNAVKHPVCVRCLEARGFTVPAPRTAADIEMTDGRPGWRAETSADPGAGRLALGHDHFFEAVIGLDEKLVGWLHTHPAKQGGPDACQSFCAVRPLNGTPVHQVVCADPLTLTPSLLCRACGAHGNVVNGKWEPL